MESALTANVADILLTSALAIRNACLACVIPVFLARKTS